MLKTKDPVKPDRTSVVKLLEFLYALIVCLLLDRIDVWDSNTNIPYIEKI